MDDAVGGDVEEGELRKMQPQRRLRFPHTHPPQYGTTYEAARSPLLHISYSSSGEESENIVSG